MNDMVLKFLLLLFPAILLYIPMALYKKTGNYMTAFYYRMAFSENTRKFYILTLLIMLLLFHYLHHSVMRDLSRIGQVEGDQGEQSFFCGR